MEPSKPPPQQGVVSEVRVTAKLVTAKPLVLIAVGDRRARMVFRLRLEGDGFQAAECGTADETWQCIGEGGVSAAILDVALSGTTMSGDDVLDRIASTVPGMAVVALSVKDEQQAEGLRRTHQRLQCLQSPAAPEMVARAVKELLDPHWVARRP